LDPDGDLYAKVYKLQYTVTWTDKDAQGNEVTLSVLVTVYVDVVFNDDGSVAGVDSSGHARNQSGTTGIVSAKQLAKMASTAASLVRSALGTDLGKRLTTDAAKVAMTIMPRHASSKSNQGQPETSARGIIRESA
jgi:hypothetical protein